MNGMKLALALLSLLFSSNIIIAQDDNSALDYIDRFKQLAMTEQIASGIPASITLAQGIYETGSGTSDLATQAHNHFGIKCKSTWKGATFLHDDDLKQECFRKYDTDEDSYRDHSEYLKKNPRYRSLFELQLTDYKAWAEGLKKAGYATNPAYVKRLVDMVEKYNLQQYTFEAISAKNANDASTEKVVGELIPNADAPSMNSKKNTISGNTSVLKEGSSSEQTVNLGLSGFWAKKGELLLGPALDRNIRYAKLLWLNDLDDMPVPADMFIYTERKRKIGMSEFHMVAPDETMQIISQREAIMLEYLYKYNNMVAGDEVEVGEKLYLRYKSFEGAPRLKASFLSKLDIKTQPVEIVQAKIVEVENPIENQVKPVVEVATETLPHEIAKEAEPAIEPIIVEEKFQSTKPHREDIEFPQEAVTASIEEPSIGTKQVAIGNPNEDKIRDAEKAKLMDELLNSNPIDGTPKKEESKLTLPTEREVERENIVAIAPRMEAKQARTIESSKAIEARVVEAKIPTQEVIQSPTRNYNEQVSDSVKDLKRKFDRIIYAPKPPKRIDTVAKMIAPKLDSIKASTGVKKVEIKKAIPVTKTEVLKKEVISKALKEVKATAIKNERKKNIDKEAASKAKIAKKVIDKKELDKASKKDKSDKKDKSSKKKSSDSENKKDDKKSKATSVKKDLKSEKTKKKK
jgi:hypothetical protein